MIEPLAPALLHIELYVQGQSVQSAAALEIVRRVCEARLKGQYQLEVIDVQQQPDRIPAAGIVATPTLIRRFPEPVLHTVGQLTEERVLNGLGLSESAAEVQT